MASLNVNRFVRLKYPISLPYDRSRSSAQGYCVALPKLLPWHAAIANYPERRFTLRNGILVIRQYPRKQT